MTMTSYLKMLFYYIMIKDVRREAGELSDESI